MTVEDIIRLLEELAAKLTPPAEYVFQLAVRQVIIDGVFAVVLAIGGLILMAISLDVWRRLLLRRSLELLERNRNKDWREKESDDIVFVTGMTAIIGGMGMIFVGGSVVKNIEIAVNYLLNPEYWTLIKLAELIR